MQANQNDGGATSEISNTKSSHALREEEILEFWEKNKIFEQSLDKKSPKGEYTFYDGPPFATGLPHYGHMLAGTIKDVIPRFRTMQGYRVARRWGWDCHGLPVENLIEKDLGLKSKKDIVDFGIDKFNAYARQSVMKYADEWRKIVPRMGRWVDMDHDYRTMDASYTESVWWSFKKLHEDGRIYKGFKSMNICPHCETTLSNFEVTQGYKDITDISVYVKFKIKDNRLGFDNAYFVAWTTTPWTLPGNVALAINPDIEYVAFRLIEENDSNIYIVAKERITNLMKERKYDIVKTFIGKEFEEIQYEPIFTYYSQLSEEKLRHVTNGWKVYAGEFVTTTDGTGIVHIAPAFGSDDLNLSIKNHLPFVQHVSMGGTMKKEVTDFVGMQVKPKSSDEDKNAHQKTDIVVLKYLAEKGFLFGKEKILHSYPHCWRCDTPLLNYATSSWFVRVEDMRDDLVKVNKKIDWIPSSVGESRFGNWLEGARDWAISRSRFWGAPIPVWLNSEGDEYVVGSIEDLKSYIKPRNTYIIMRHGEAENNILGILSGDPDFPHTLTTKGEMQVEKTAKKLKGRKFDHIFVSPFVRTKRTLEIMRKSFSWTEEMISFDTRLREIGVGDSNGMNIEEYFKSFPIERRFDIAPKGGEKYGDIKKRMGDFIYDIDSRYEGKNILIITHETPAFLLECVVDGLNKVECLERRKDEEYIKNAEYRDLDFRALPHNDDFEIDLHRPFIDNIVLRSEKGEILTRVPDVFDCWFESGSMPFASNGYPKKNLKFFNPKKKTHFPADFIAEGLDQTRGWFYSLLVLGVSLFNKSPYNKVIVNGLILASDGQKMSKSKKNYPDLLDIVNKYSADALRFYLLSSPVVRGEDLCFSEKGVDEVVKKISNRLLNVLEFYKMYANQTFSVKKVTDNILDEWMHSVLNKTIKEVTLSLEDGYIDRATRSIENILDDLSTWYLRRSRDRFKGETVYSAVSSLGYFILEISKILAPFMPFLSEYIFGEMKNIHANKSDFAFCKEFEKTSIHLLDWPKSRNINQHLLDEMKIARELSSKGLEARSRSKINVRQPLASLKTNIVSIQDIDEDLRRVILDEVNVKSIIYEKALKDEVSLDTMITTELKEEGIYREINRMIQDMRKESKLTVKDIVNLNISTDDMGKRIVDKYSKELKQNCSVREIVFDNIRDSEGVNIQGINIKIEIK